MANVNVTLKRYNGASDDIIFPKTSLGQVYQTYVAEGDGANVLLNDYLDNTFLNVNKRGAANGVASLDASGKILYSELPEGVVGGLKNLGAISKVNVTDVADLTGRFQNVIGHNLNTEALTLPYIGWYYIVGETMTIADSAIPGAGIFEFTGEEDDATYSPTLEPGDWVMLTGWGGTEPIYSVINQTYRDATDVLKGIVTLADPSHRTLGYTTTNVLTESYILGLVVGDASDLDGAANSNKLAPARHTHTALYQAKNTRLTNISGFANESNATTYGILVNTNSGVAKKTHAELKSILDLEIGTDVQAYSSNLATLAGVSSGAMGRSILATTDEAGFKIATNLQSGIDVQAYNSKLAYFADTTFNSIGFLLTTASNTVEMVLPATARTRLDVYSETEVDNELALRPRIYYDTIPGTRQTGDITIDVV